MLSCKKTNETKLIAQLSPTLLATLTCAPSIMLQLSVVPFECILVIADEKSQLLPGRMIILPCVCPIGMNTMDNHALAHSLIAMSQHLSQPARGILAGFEGKNTRHFRRRPRGR